jgi:hypothetical protein
MKTPLGLTAVLVLGFTACGSSDGVAATAKQGDAFCKLAQSAKVDHDALDSMDISKPDTVKLNFGAAVDSLSAVVAKAPKDIVDTAKLLLAKEEDLEKLLKDNDYDVAKMAATDEGQKLSDDKEAEQAGDEFDKYLSDKCGIATDDTTPSDTLAPDETAPPGDTVEPGVTIDLGEGEDAINKFLDFYEIGTGAKLTSEERSCIVGELSDKVQGTELTDAVNGNPSPELEQALGLAFLDCKVAVQS